MEAFNLLKFWRNSSLDTTSSTQDIVSELDDLDYIRNPVIDTDEETDEDDEDSFFDLVFTGPNQRPKVETKTKTKSISPAEPESPRDVFFKPKSFPIDSESKPQSPISILKSAPKFRVLFLGFRKSKPEKVDIDDCSVSSPKIHSPKVQSKRFTVEKVPVSVPVSPVFTRDNSLRSKLQKEKEDDISVDESLKKFVKTDVSKYLKLMKPLYAKASKRYTRKIGAGSGSVSLASSPLSSPSSLSSPRKPSGEKQGNNRVAAFGAMRKHLGKSRSSVASFTGGASPSPMNRRDDSLMEQNDRIQGAILHCKRSYSSVLSKCEDLSRASTEELNRWSI